MLRRKRTVRVQSVLYRNDVEALGRFVRSVQTAATVAARVCRTTGIMLGDCSPEPLLRTEALAKLSTDSSVDVSYETFGANLGHGGGHNELMKQAREDLVLIVNPDTVLAPDLLHELVSAMKPRVGICEARQIPFEHPKAFDPVTGATAWASGACMLIRSAAYRDVGGFDADNFFLHGDDVDLGWRIRLAGNRIRYVPSATIFHDKRFGADGAVDTSGDAERYESHLAGLMLAQKWGQPDIVNHLRHFCGQASDPLLNSVAEEWDARLAAGRVPAPIASAADVAQFIGSHYAEHRF